MDGGILVVGESLPRERGRALFFLCVVGETCLFWSFVGEWCALWGGGQVVDAIHKGDQGSVVNYLYQMNEIVR